MPGYRIFLASLADGFTSALRLFDRVERPGSSSAVLDGITTPDKLAVFAETHPATALLLLDLKEKEHKRDAAYSIAFRICGSICLLATVAALCFVSLRR